MKTKGMNRGKQQRWMQWDGKHQLDIGGVQLQADM